MTHGIGIVGAGTIVEHGHLPAYRGAGLPVRALYDQDRSAAVRVAELHGLEVVDSVDQLLNRADVDIIDIAVTPQAQVDLAERALAAGRHVLCQKPLAPTLPDAEALVARCATFSGKRAVNQQMRWEPIVDTVRRHLDDGTLGRPVSAQIFTNMSADFPEGHWLAAEQRLMALYGAIHFVDSARYLFGEPSRVWARLKRDPLQRAAGEMWINAWIEWPDGLLLNISERYVNWAGDLEARMRVEGTSGTVRGRFGIWDAYPSPAPSLAEWKAHGDTEWVVESDRRSWMPDAFAMPMLDLIDAIDADRTPATGWQDNLRTMRVVEALYESDRLATSVELTWEPEPGRG